MRRALQAPTRQIADNAGLAGSFIVRKLLDRQESGFGLDARSGQLTDMYDAGIIDATRVVRAALRCAGSIAGLITTTAAMIAQHKEPRGH